MIPLILVLLLRRPFITPKSLKLRLKLDQDFRYEIPPRLLTVIIYRFLVTEWFDSNSICDSCKRTNLLTWANYKDVPGFSTLSMWFVG